MSADIFLRRWLLLLVLLGVLLAAVPFGVQLLTQNSGCEATNACANMTETLTYYGRRLVLAAVVVPLVLALLGRTLTVGAFVWAFPFGLLMIAGATPLYFAAAEYLATGAEIDVFAHPATPPLLFLLLLLLALSAYPDEHEGRGAVVWRTLLGVLALAALFVTAPSWTPGFADVPYLGHFALPLAMTLARGHAALGIGDQLAPLASYCLIAFILGAAGLVIAGQGDGGGRRVRS